MKKADLLDMVVAQIGETKMPDRFICELFKKDGRGSYYVESK